MAIVAARNTVFIRHLSPAISESILRNTFSQCDVIEQVLFRAFPGRKTEYYAQIDFASSKGVVEAHKLSGIPIQGVLCQVSVMDPGSKEMLRKAAESQQNGAQPDELERPHIAEPQGVQAEYFRKYKAQMEQKRFRTVHVGGLDDEHTEAGLRALCTRFGEIEALRMDRDTDGKPFALVEFKEKAPATACKSRQGFVVDGKVIVFTEAKTLVDDNTYVEQSVHFASPFFDIAELKSRGVQSHLTPKVAQARLAAAEIMNEPVPEELKAMEKSAAASEEQPIEWAGRSEKDFLRELAELSRRPPARRRSRSRERKRSAGGSSKKRRRDSSRSRRRRASRDQSADRGQRKALEDGQHKKEARLDATAADAPPADAPPETYDAEDLELAVVPNTELLVLGESSSYSGSPSPERDGTPATNPLAQVPAQAAATAALAPGEHVVAVSSAACVEADAASVAPRAMPSVMDVDEKEQWLPPVDVDEEGSCDEIIVANDALSSPNTLDVDADAAEVQAIDASSVPIGSSVSDVAAGHVPGGTSFANGAGEGQSAGASSSAGVPVEPSASAALPLAASPMASPGSAPDHWECAACGEVNRAKRDQCNNCGGDAPWITVKSPDGKEVDEEVSSASSPSTPKSIAESAGSAGDVVETKSVAESAPRSVAASGSFRSVPASAPGSVADLASADSGAEEGGVLDVSEAEREDVGECTVEAERVRGEIADARARIYHAAH